MRLISIANGFQVDYMINYVNSLADKVEEIEFIGSDIYPKEKISGKVKFINLRGGHQHKAGLIEKISRIFIYYLKLIRFLNKSKKDKIVHLQWLRFFVIDGILLPVYCKLLGYKVIYTVHDVIPHDRDNRLNRWLFKMIYNIHWKLVVHTQFIANRLMKEFNIIDEKIAVIKHGVYEINDSQIIKKSEAKQKLEILPDEVLLLFFGYVTYYKGLDLLLQSHREINDSKIKLIVAGEVKDSYAEDVNKLSSSYTDGVIYKLHYISDEELQTLFNAADITVLPYREASQSGVLFMSYAYGVPVLAPELGGFPFDIKSGTTGMLFEPNRQQSLSETLQSMISAISNEAKFNREEIRQFAKNTYSWDRSGKELVEFLTN